MNNNVGILLIHGFAGSVEDVAPLRDYLVGLGYETVCPLLPGHGGTKKELAESSRAEWIAAAEKAYLDLARRYNKVVVIGFSMGGLLAFNLWHYGFSGLVTVNAPVYYWNPRWIAINLLTNFKAAGEKYLKASTDKSISSMLEFQKLLTGTKPMISNITCSTLVIQSLDDDTVHHKSADYIYRRLRTQKSLHKLPQGGHMIFQSENGKEVCRMIGDFVGSSKDFKLIR